jgi:hypothetical protein
MKEIVPCVFQHKNGIGCSKLWIVLQKKLTFLKEYETNLLRSFPIEVASIIYKIMIKNIIFEFDFATAC